MRPDKGTLSITNYQAGSYVMVEDRSNDKKKQDTFFIIRSGKVQVENLVDQMLGQKDQILGPGGFFGVVSAMSGQESNQTVVTLTDCSMIMVKSTKFSDLVVEAPSIALKIIRSLSNSLRHYDNELAARIVDANHTKDNSKNLFLMGEFYYKAKELNHANMIFTSYLEHYPNGAQKSEAQNYIDEMGITVPSHNNFNRTYQDGEMICAEHMPGSELYIIQNGKVKITKILNNQERLLAILDAGEIVGEMSLLNHKERTANIIAYGETKIMAVSKDNFDRIILQNKNLATKLLIVLADRLWTIYKQLANLLIEDPLNRLWDTLLTQLLKQHVQCERKAKYEFSFGKTELLNMCSFSSEVGEKAFKSLMTNRYMSLNDEGKLVCNDLEELKKTVELAHKIEIRARKMRIAKQQQQS